MVTFDLSLGTHVLHIKLLRNRGLLLNGDAFKLNTNSKVL